MKVISIIFSIILVLPITYFLSHIFVLYDSKGTLKSFGLTNRDIAPLALPIVVLLMVYLAASVLAIYFNIKKKYTTNTIFVSVMIVFYMIITLFRLP
jgi:hypothetical protein